jgi:hypothetical protein
MSKLKQKYSDLQCPPTSDSSSSEDDHEEDLDLDSEEEEDDRDSEDEDDDVIRCICGKTNDDGFSIQCEECETWQHGRCVKITKKTVPDYYICRICQDRKNSKKSFLKSSSFSPPPPVSTTNQNRRNNSTGKN